MFLIFVTICISAALTLLDFENSLPERKCTEENYSKVFTPVLFSPLLRVFMYARTSSLE